MTKDAILQFLACLGADKIKYRPGWVLCSCPLAPWTHAKGTDSSPSFGIKVEPGGGSKYNCFSCGEHGDLTDLLMFMKMRGGMPGVDFKTALKMAEEDDNIDEFDVSVPDYDSINNKKVIEFTEFPEWWLDSFSKRYDHPYTVNRGIPPEVCEKLDVRFDFSENRLCFPIRTIGGVLAGLQGRYISDPVPEQVLRYKLYGFMGKYNRDVWANEHNLDLSDPLVLTEGWFDVAKIMQVYPNVAGSLTSQIAPKKASRVRDASTVITFYDHGTGGDHGRKLVDKYWAGSTIYHIIPDHNEGDAGGMSVEEIRSCLLPLL